MSYSATPPSTLCTPKIIIFWLVYTAPSKSTSTFGRSTSGTLRHLSESRSAITESKKAIASLTSELDCGPFLSMNAC